MCACTLYFQKLESLAYIFVGDSMGLSLLKICAVASKRRIFSATKCVLAIQGHPRSSEVDNFGTSRKRVYDFLLVGHCDYGTILHRFWDTSTNWLKIAYFSYPSLIWRPRSLYSLRNFALPLTQWGWAILQWRSHDRSMSRIESVSVWRTDGQTDGFTIASTVLCTASYADAL